MRLRDRLKDDLKAAMKAREDDKKDAIRVVMGEMARLDKKQLPDDQIVKICKKLIKPLPPEKIQKILETTRNENLSIAAKSLLKIE